jgi:predicted cupin superfamily sugar epimerase
MTDAVDQLIQALALEPHPEGGHYRRVYASQVEVEHHGAPRPALTAIEFLLRRGQCSRWHRVDADEAWHWQDGGALHLQTYDPASDALVDTLLGDRSRQARDLLHVVPAGQWQRAWTSGPFALVACTVSPGFVWEGFALLDAAPDIARRLRALGADDQAQEPLPKTVPAMAPNR